MAKKKKEAKRRATKAPAKKTLTTRVATKERAKKASARGGQFQRKFAAAAYSSPSEELRIAVTFRRPSDGLGLTKYGAPMTSEVVHDFCPDEVTVGKALSALEKSGFQVTSRGRLSVSMRCKRRAYERVFGTKLSVCQMRADGMTQPSAASVYYPADDAPWNPDPTLAALIDEAYIQWPHIYMNSRFSLPSPIPPRVRYHHLRVPGDLQIVLNAAKVHRQGQTGRAVKVAMIDSGFNHDRNYFQEMGYNTSTVLAPGATHSSLDGDGHGTGESANLLAIAPDVTFIGVKLDNENDPRLGASVLEGFQEALKHDPQVISVSLGFDLCPTDSRGSRTSNQHLTSLPNGLRALEAEIQAAVADGIVVVFSAGNGHVAFPGMMREVICAGGVYVDEDGSMRASDYASAFVSKIYPGRRVPDFCGLVGLAANRAEYIMLPVQASCQTDQEKSQTDETASDDGWGVFSGTSAAAPQLAGVSALLLEANPSLTPSQVKAVLRRTARDVVKGSANPASNEDQGGMPAGPGADGATGAGLVDAFAAWNQV